jgi:hypothetical protein
MEVLNHIANQTIATATHNEMSPVDSNSFLFILSAKNVMLPGVLRIQKELQYVYCGLCWFIILIGSYFKIVMFSFLREKWNMKQFTEIDSLILVNAIIQHLAILLWEFKKTIIVFSGDSLSNVTGPWFCIIIHSFLEFELLYSVIGSLGISIYRIILLKADLWIKYRAGERNMRQIIIFFGILLATVFVILMNINKNQQVYNENCKYSPDPEMLGMLDDYKQSLGEVSVFYFWHFSRFSIGIVMLWMTSAELTLYIVFFHHIYKHDNSERIKRIYLEPLSKHSF